MNKRKHIYIILWIGLTLLFIPQLCAQDNEINAINKVLENSEWGKLSDYCQETISLSIQNSQGNYSKVQARYILADHFKKYPSLKTSEINRDKISTEFFFCILQRETENKIFNIYYTIQKKESSFLIFEIQIKEKTK